MSAGRGGQALVFGSPPRQLRAVGFIGQPAVICHVDGDAPGFRLLMGRDGKLLTRDEARRIARTSPSCAASVLPPQ